MSFFYAKNIYINETEIYPKLCNTSIHFVGRYFDQNSIRVRTHTFKSLSKQKSLQERTKRLKCRNKNRSRPTFCTLPPLLKPNWQVPIERAIGPKFTQQTAKVSTVPSRVAHKGKLEFVRGGVAELAEPQRVSSHAQINCRPRNRNCNRCVYIDLSLLSPSIAKYSMYT